MSVASFIAGAGQHTFRDGAPHPAAAMAHACRLALEDTGIGAADVELIGCVEPLSWAYEDLGRSVADELGLRSSIGHLWVPAGGTSPQDLLHQIGERIAAGELDCAVICGAESMRTRRRAGRDGAAPDWPERAADVNPMRGQAPFTSELERRHGLLMPIHVFPLFENAIRAAAGRSEAEQTAIAAGLLARNAKVAAGNPHAWFRDAPTAADIGTVTAENRLIAYPYTKRMNAIMDVDQCAAIVVASRTWLEARGRLDRSAAILGGAGVEEIWNPIERTTFSECLAMQRAFEIALDRAGLDADQIDAMDLYSCFPSAIQLALIALASDPGDPRPLSLTGGLAFAGGPGNAYVLHSLATALETIRSAPASRVLVTGVGMANTKHAATILTGADAVPADASGVTSYREMLGVQPRVVEPEGNGEATVCTYTIEYDRDGAATNVILALDLANGKRTIANMADPVAAADALRSREPVGRRGNVAYDPATERNHFAFADGGGRA